MSDWYYAENNEQKGPILETELKGMLAAKKLPANALVWKEGMAAWTPASDVSALATAASPSPVAAAAAAVTSAATTAVASATAKSNPQSVTPVTTADIIGTPEALEVDSDDADKNKIFGIIAYLGILCLVPLFAAKDSPFAKYHTNQGFTLFIAEVVIWIVEMILSGLFYLVFPVGINVIGIVFDLVGLGILVLIILGIVNAARGKCVPLPLRAASRS